MESINDVISEYIEDCELYDISELSAISRMSNIILGSKVPSFNDKIKNRFGISKSFELSYEFFEFLGNDYGKYFIDRVSSDDLILKYDKKGMEIPCSFLDELGEKRIYLPYSMNICDSFSLTHEMLHDMNFDVNNTSLARNIFTEYISILGEILFEDFINYNYDIKCCCNNRYTFNGVYVKAIIVDFQINLVKCFLDKGFIYEYDLGRIINNYNSYYHDYLYELYDKIISDNKLSIMYEYRYLVGMVLSCYSKDLMLNKKYDIDLYKYINDNINDMFPEEVYRILDLEVCDDYTMELSNDSYKKLGNSYCKYLR